MNDTEKNQTSKSNLAKWQKIGWAVLLVLLLGYHFGRPTLEKWTGMSLPALDGSQDDVADADPLPDKSEANSPGGPDSNSADTLPPKDKAGTKDSGQPANSSTRTSPSRRSKANMPNAPPKGGSPVARNPFELKDLGRNRLRSPAGLVYAMGPRGEHRVDHVLAHTRDNLSKPAHGVFNLKSKEEVLRLIDLAFRKIKKNKIKPNRDRDREEYVINMGKVIGYKGGRAGQRKKTKLNRLKLILQDGNEVITAFPY